MTIEHKAAMPVAFNLSETGDVMVAFSRFNVIDKDQDVTFPGALPVGKAVAMSAYGHTSWDGAPPIGKGVIGESGDLGIMTGGFFMETDQGRNSYHTVKAMADLQEWSYGYVPLPPSGPGTFQGQKVRELRKLDVWEVSPVLVGAGVSTSTLALKSGGPGADLPYAEYADWVQAVMKAFVERTSDRIDWRGKEGRTLSAANRSMMADMIEPMRAVGGHADTLQALLDSTDPQKATREADIKVRIAIARSLGVPV